MTEEEEIGEIRPLCKLCFEAFGDLFRGGACPWRLGDGRRIICREKRGGKMSCDRDKIVKLLKKRGVEVDPFGIYYVSDEGDHYKVSIDCKVCIQKSKKGEGGGT